MSAEREGRVRSVHVRLVRHAHEIDVDPNLVLTRYAVERVLYRLSRSPHAERFVLEEALARIMKDVAGQEVEPDAVEFLADSVRVEPIRVVNDYGVWRATIQARVRTARLTVQVDVGIGDVVTPAPEWLEYPGLLDLPRPRLRACSRASVAAENLHATVLFGTRNSRMKDYFRPARAGAGRCRGCGTAG